MSLQYPSLARDYWALESAEDRHNANPDTFWIPDLDTRQSLERGTAARLLFVIETLGEDDRIEATVERMWVVVSDRIGGQYIGRLTNRPASIVPDERTYLVIDCEVPFGPEHVIDTDEPPQEYLEDLFSEPPTRVWMQKELNHVQ